MAEEKNIYFVRTLCTVTLESIFPIHFSGHILGLNEENLSNNQSIRDWRLFPLFS